MTTTKTKPPAVAPKKKTTAKAVSHAKPMTPPRVIAEIHLIPIDRIEVRDQVRTAFFEDSISELAADIEARGLRSPVEVTPVGDERYLLTLGGRRLRAVKVLGHKEIPAIIVPTSEKDRLLDQLAENIQREDLSLADEAKAIHQIFEELQDMEKVGQLVKKSKSWVSKRVMAACPNFGWRARALLEAGVIGDLEILGTLSQIERQCGYLDAERASQQIKNGEMNRQQAREFLKTGKAKLKKQNAASSSGETTAAQKQREDAQAEHDRKKKEATEGIGEPFIRFATEELSDILTGEKDGMSGEQFLGLLRQDQRDVLEAHLVTLASGAKEVSFKSLVKVFHPWNREQTYIEQMAILAGLIGADIKGGLYAVVVSIQEVSRRTAEE